MSDQQVTTSAVNRIVSRDYAPEEHPMVMAVLEKYGPKPHHVERDRVRLCALKLASGDLRELDRHINVACTDFRDVVGAAEYPEQLRLGFRGFDQIDVAKRAEIEDRDRQQFLTWLERQIPD